MNKSFPELFDKYQLQWEGVVELSTFLTDKPNEKRLLGRLRCKVEDNIRMELKQIGVIVRNWINSAQVSIIGQSL